MQAPRWTCAASLPLALLSAGVESAAAHAQKTVREPAALQVGLELLLDVRRQGLAPLGQVRDECRVVLLHQPVETGFLGAVARVGESTGGFPAMGMHRLRVPAHARGDSVWAHGLCPSKELACHASGQHVGP